MQSLVSVVTTALNAEAFLSEAIASVIAQTCGNWELLLVDDGSTDSTASIANSWAVRDRRIRLLTHPGCINQGISASRNLGLQNVRGSFVAFLDADDVWLPEKLERQLSDLSLHPEAAMTFGVAERWHSWDTASDARDFVVTGEIPGWGSDRLLPPPVLVEAFLQDESLAPCTCAVLVRREAMERADGFESAFRGLYDDQVFYAKLALAEPVYFSSACVARYRQHANSCCAMARRDGTEAKGRELFLAWLNNYQKSGVASALRSRFSK